MKVTLITGASGGIGEAFARRLAAEKHNLVLVARTENKLHELCDELMLKHQITAHYIALDLSETDADARLFEETERKGFEVEWLINNAGFGLIDDFAGAKLERQLEMIRLNVVTLTALTHRYLQPMRRRKSGVIINVASTASFQPIPFVAVYAATKAFVRFFSEAIAEENRPYQIVVQALCPGPTDTNFFNVAAAEDFNVKSVQTPEEVVETALRGVANGDAQVVSGWMNFLIARAQNVVPNWLIGKFIAGSLRSRVENKK